MKPSSCWVHAAVAALVVSSCTRDVTIPPQPSSESFISGRVVQAVPGTDQSQTLAGASVTVLGTDLHVVTDALGGFTVGPLPEGSFQLYVAARGENDLLRQRLVSGVGTTRGATRSVGDVSVQENAQLGGRALVDGKERGNAGVLVFVPGTDFITNSGDPGTWTLRNLPAGTVRVSAFRTGFMPATTSDLELQGGVVTSAADLLLFPEAMSASPGALSGSVVVMGAADFSGVKVRAVSVTSQASAAETTTDAAGVFRLSALPADLYTLVASHDGYPDVRVPNLAIGAGVEVALASPLVFSRLSETNTPFDGGLGIAQVVEDAGAPPVDAGAPDAGAFDGGFVGECLTEAECASGKLCVNHFCVGCDATTPCKTGSSCVNGLCRKDCATNAGCPAGQVCQGGACGACTTSAQCQDPSLICDASGACTHCQNRSQCPAGKACLPQGCGDCATDSECGPNSICELGVCLTGSCHTNLGCPATQACLSHVCTTCGQDGDCRLGQLCLAGACVQGDCRQPADCGAGQVCLNNLCGPCGRDSDCASGSICVPTGAGLRCQPGVCHTLADCSGANAGKVCDSTNQCVPCARTSDCADATKVCDAATLRCVTGNCSTAADCASLGLSGQVCVSNTCTPCSQDAQCATGQLCLSGRCKTANCKDNSWCSGGSQICELSATNPAAAQYTCRPCSPIATINSADCGGANRVCDAAGSCHLGTCFSQAQCTNGLACLNYSCTSCTTDAQCGGNGLLCVSNKCVSATCHGALPDPNADCSATQVCVNNLCVGNCRTNADCAGSTANPGSNYCDQATHSCSACTNITQCGGLASGKVCAGGACVSGSCTLFGATPNDAPCAAGFTCVANQCAQVGPMPLSSAPYTEAYPVSTGATPTMVAGQSQLYLSANNSTQGSFSLALDASRQKVWRVSDSIGGGRPYGPPNGGLVLPAPGFPGGELFVSVTGTNGNNVVAHRADTGAVVWTMPGSTQNSAVSMVGGVPQFVRTDNFGGGLKIVWADGSKQRDIALGPCGGNMGAVVGGTQWVYAVCGNGVYGVDPINDVIAWSYPITLSVTYAMVWRPPGLTGPLAGDLLVTTSTVGSAPLLALFIPDVSSGVPTPTAKLHLPTFGGLYGPPFIDAQGAGHFLVGGVNKLTKLSLLDGSTLATVTLPLPAQLFTLTQAGDGTLVATYPIGSNLWGLAGMTVTNGVPGAAALKWQVGTATTALSNAYPLFSALPAVLQDGGVYDGGVMDLVTATSLGSLVQVAGLGLPGPSLVPRAPAWGVGGDLGNRMCAPAYQCQSTADCGATQQCVLGRCIGSCRSAADCSAGQGCSLATCAPCAVDLSCRAGEVCNAGTCFACDRATNPNCCSTTAECGAGKACVQGLCRATPTPLGTGSWLQPIGTGTLNATSSQVMGTDGTLYAFDSASPPAVHAYASDGTPLWTSPAAPGALYLSNLPMVMRVGTQDVLFVDSNGGNTFYTAVVSPLAFGGWKTLNTFSLVGSTSVPAMAQGVFDVLGAKKPAVFMSSQGKLWALDAQAAALGTPAVFWQQPNTGCTEPATLGGTWMMVGSDGTAYHVCSDGSVQAWHPDGLTSQPVGATRPGNLLWTSTPPVAFVPGARPAMGKVPSSTTDVLYLGQANANASSVLRVSAAGVASRTEVAASGSWGFLVDAAGNALALSGQLNNIVALTPAGTVAGFSSNTYSLSGANHLLTSDGLLWFIDSKTNPATLVGLQLASLATPTLAFRVSAPGNLPWDSFGSLTFLPQALSTTGSPVLTVDDNLSGLGYPTSRMLVGMPVASGSATLAQWGTQGGDAQHRASLKTQ